MQSYTEHSEEKLVELYKNGDSAAFDELYARYKRIINAAARSYYLGGGDKDDLLQEGFLGLLKAADSYDSARGGFKTYAYVCIRSKIISAVKSAKSYKNKPLIDYVSIYGPSTELQKLLSDDPEDKLIDGENSAEFIQAINKKLSKLEIIVLKLYLEGLSYAEIGERVGRDGKSVDNAMQRVKKKIEAL